MVGYPYLAWSAISDAKCHERDDVQLELRQTEMKAQGLGSATGDAKYHGRDDVQLELWQMEMKAQGLEYCFISTYVGTTERNMRAFEGVEMNYVLLFGIPLVQGLLFLPSHP